MSEWIDQTEYETPEATENWVAEIAEAVKAPEGIPFTGSLYCGNTSGTYVCDRIDKHDGHCSWQADVMQLQMAVQVNEIYELVQLLKAAIPPGMVPGL